MQGTWKHLVLVLAFLGPATSQESTFTNPVLVNAVKDFSITKVGTHYFLAISESPFKELKILKSQFLTDFRNAESKIIYKVPAGYNTAFPSSFLEYEDNLYLYFYMENESGSHRMFVIKAEDLMNPLGPWSAASSVLDKVWSLDSIQGAVLNTQDQIYFTWNSRNPVDNKLSIYIAKMTNPMEVVTPVLLLKEPSADWECSGQCVNEAPEFIFNRHQVYLVFSASSSNLNTSISYMSIEIGLDPLQQSNWNLLEGPIFQGNVDEKVFSTRFAEFVTSPDGTEVWMAYTASSDLSSVYETSRVRIEKVLWEKNDGFPKFSESRGDEFKHQLPSGEPAKYVNPILQNYGRTASVLYLDNFYYVVHSNQNYTALVILKSNKLYDFSNAEEATIYTVPEEIKHVTTGRIIQIGNKIYVYFYATNRMFVLVAPSTSNLMQDWGTAERLLDGIFEGSPYQGTVLQHNLQLYFIWANASTENRNLYIAPMSSPTLVTEPVVLLKQPSEVADCNGTCINDWPSVVYNNNTAFLFYSSISGNEYFCNLYYMSIQSGRDPLDTSSWFTNLEPAFEQNESEKVFGPCHATFTDSPDGSETWMLYHAHNTTLNIVSNWTSRIEKIYWNSKTGTPTFPKPHGPTNPQPVPSEFEYFANPVIDESSESPAVIHIGDFYYMLPVSYGGMDLTIFKSGKLSDFRNTETLTVYSIPIGYTSWKSGRIHLVNGQLCIYFAMEHQSNVTSMFVICAEDQTNPMGKWWSTPIPLVLPGNMSASHGSILEHSGASYIAWTSPHPETGFNSIYLAKLENVTHATEPFIMLRHPTELFECEGGCSNEAPFFIYNNGTSYMIHSVSLFCDGGNGLSYMSISGDKDPLDVISWVKAADKVFSDNTEQGVFCPGHATFATSPDGQETWMMYQAADSPLPKAFKSARTEKISWSESGYPVFPKPHGSSQPQVVPGKKKIY